MLDREDLVVTCGLARESFHGCRKGVIGVVDEDVTLADDLEDVCWFTVATLED